MSLAGEFCLSRLLPRALLLLLLPFHSVFAAETEVAVDCNAGQSVNEAINTASGDEPLVVTLTGICREVVAINRDDVTLQGATPADGLGVPAQVGESQFFVVTAANGVAENVTLRSMTIDGGSLSGVFCGSGTTVYLDGVTLDSDAGGILAIGNSTCRVANSIITGAGTGVGSGIYATTGAHVELVTTTIDGFQVGVIAQTNASLLVGAFFGAVNIRNNDIGLMLEAGASAQVSQALIENNNLDGVLVNPTASFTVAGPSTSLTVLNNGGHGVSLQKNTNAVIRGARIIIQGNGGATVNCGSNVGLVLSNIVEAALDGPPQNCT